MDGSYLFQPISFFEYLSRQAAAAKQRQRGGPKARTGKKAMQSARVDGGDNFFSVLVEKDRLFFGVLSHASRPASHQRQAEDSAGQDSSVRLTFRRVFGEVWCRIPEPDRQILLIYWREQRPRSLYGDCSPPPRHNPLIRVIDAGSLTSTYPLCEKIGHQLNFPISLVTDERLPTVIARALARVYLYASREHWRLVMELIEEPLAKWESQEGKTATEASHAKKVDALEKAFLRKHDLALARVMKRWGFKESQPGKEPLETQRREPPEE